MKRKSTVAIAAVAVMAASAVGFMLPSGASAASADVTVDWKIASDWGTGFQGAVTVHNNTDRAIDPWSVTIPYGNAIGSIWDATAQPVSGGYAFSGPTWNRSLAAHASATFGFIGASNGAGLVPTTCTVTGATCAIIGTGTTSAAPSASPTAAPTASASASSSPSTPTTTSTPTATSASTTGAAVSVAVKVTSDWGTGRNVDLTITNTGSSSIDGWTVSMPWAGSSVSMWNATARLAGGTLSATNASWNGSLAPGASASVGMTDTGAFVTPATCTWSAGPCAITGAPASASTSTSSPTATASPTATSNYAPTQGGYVGSKKIIAYYPAWATYARNYQVADIPGQKLTHVNYAFANVRNGQCVLGDSYADADKAFAGDTWDQGALRGNFNQLTKLKAANPGLRTLISVGGWTWSANFATAAATDASRTAFASSCVTFMKQYGFDGIDIDWEYPVSGGLQAGTAADKQNYTALLQELKSQLNAAEITDGRQYDLTIAAPAGPTTIPNLEAGKIGGIIDWMNLMSYDYHGGWDAITGHNAPMTVGPKDAATGFSVTDAVDAYLKSGFPAGKLVLGVPFYGRGWQGVGSTDHGLYQPGSAASVGTWENGVFDYTDIVANYLPRMTRYWDADAKVPYLYDSTSKLWISYDDPTSMKAKADYIRAKGLGGAMIWEITADRSQQLLDVLVSNL